MTYITIDGISSIPLYLFLFFSLRKLTMSIILATVSYFEVRLHNKLENQERDDKGQTTKNLQESYNTWLYFFRQNLIEATKATERN